MNRVAKVLPEMRVKFWNAKRVDKMTRAELIQSLSQAATLITILAGDVARTMNMCDCAACVDDDACRYTDSAGRLN